MKDLLSYAIKCRRYLHQHPETGFDLPLTTAFVEQELEKSGLQPTDRYGTSSVVAELGPENAPIWAFRADMDALPIEEQTGLPFSSCHPGKMHACGHDTHTAILLATAKYLKQKESELPCRLRFIFQPSEECAESGAKMMVEHGVMAGVTAVVGTHCENRIDTGLIGICPGDYRAACAPILLEFFGKTSHAAAPAGGVDAIAMAHRAYTELKEAVAALAENRPYIWSVGTVQGGTAHNVVADYCKMDISFRFYDHDFADQVHQTVLTVGNRIAAEFGGSFKLTWRVSTDAVRNDPARIGFFENLLKSSGIPTTPVPKSMGSEDFGWYLSKAPGFLFRFGTGTQGQGKAHQTDFIPDEAGMENAIRAFITLALNL